MGFRKGDYVIADRAELDDWSGITWVIVEFKRNMLGEEIVKVEDIATGSTTVFYPRELSWEDGTRPEND